MSSRPPAKKRRRVSPDTSSVETSSSTAVTTDLSAIVAALVPAITKGVVETLQSMGVIPAKDTTVQEAGNNSEQQSPSQQLSVNPQPSASPLIATIDNGEDTSNSIFMLLFIQKNMPLRLLSL